MAKKKSGSILGGLVVGWDSIEPILVGCVAARLNLILRGLHGSAKTVFAKLVAEAIGGQYRHYDATKDDMVSVAGIPNPKALALGKFRFAKHGRSIWKADVISVDELTRAPKETQNMWLEIFEEKKCFGFDLNYKMAIATMNPSTYSATYRLDEALLDRFAAVVEIPNILTGNGDVIASNTADVIEMNINGRGKRNGDYLSVLSSAIQRINAQYEASRRSGDVINGVRTYVAQFMRELANEAKNKDFYISPRRMVLLYETIIACAAYYKFAQTLGMVIPKHGMFVEAAKMATTYVVGVPLNVDPKIISGCHDRVKDVLVGVIGCEADKLRREIQDSGTVEEKIAKMEESLDLVATWTPAEIGSISNMLTEEVFDDILSKVKEMKNNPDGLIASCSGADTLSSLFEKMMKYPEASIKAAGKTSFAGCKGKTVDLMLELANEYGKRFVKDRVYVCTYAKIKTATEVNKNIEEIWQGKMVNNSVTQTVKVILQKV